MSERRLVALRQITDGHFVLVGGMLKVKLTKNCCPQPPAPDTNNINLKKKKEEVRI